MSAPVRRDNARHGCLRRTGRSPGGAVVVRCVACGVGFVVSRARWFGWLRETRPPDGCFHCLGTQFGANAPTAARVLGRTELAALPGLGGQVPQPWEQALAMLLAQPDATARRALWFDVPRPWRARIRGRLGGRCPELR